MAAPAALAHPGHGGDPGHTHSEAPANGPAPERRAAPPWRAADTIASDLFDAQASLLFDEPDDGALADARSLLSGRLAAGLAEFTPAELELIRFELSRAERAFAAGDEVGLAAARGTVVAALRRGAFAVTVGATAEGRVAEARDWLQIRDFRQTTRFTRPAVDATVALQELAAGEIEPAEAVVQVRKDLLDTYQSRLATNQDEAEQAAERGFDARWAETAAMAEGYWRILAPEFADQRGEDAASRATMDFAWLAATAAESDRGDLEIAQRRVARDLDGFVAAPFTPEEQARRAQQLIRFLDLIPIEYDDGTSDGRVTIPFELQEATAFFDGVQQAYADLKAPLVERDPAAVERLDADLARMEKLIDDAYEQVDVVDESEVDGLHARISDELDSAFPDEWKESSDEADYDLVDIAIDQLIAAAGAGQKAQAEQARLSAYAFFEFGPEPKLNAFDPQLVLDVEGLFWYGARDVPGLAQLISSGAPPSEVRETTVVLEEALGEARTKTGEGASDGTVITNAALIVFREGLEAILIIAAITASMIGGRAALRRPIYRGALLALPASVLAFVVAVLVLDSLAQYGEKLEALVGIVAIAVLLVVMNWFFHRVYWTEWIATHRKRGKALTGAVAAGATAGAATVAGLYVLGFTSVFREGMETVLFLQALQLSSGLGVVVAGVLLGLAGTAAVGYLTFRLERKLPYKKMLIVTGVLIAVVLFTMVGNTIRTLQGVGWFPITPVDVEFPMWMGTWLGVHPSVETLVGQFLALVFVIGSYWLAGWVSKRKLRSEREAWLERAGGAEQTPERLNQADQRSDKSRTPISSAGPK